MDAIQTALPLTIEQDQGRWLKNRPATSFAGHQHGDTSADAAAAGARTDVAKAPASVPVATTELAGVPMSVPGCSLFTLSDALCNRMPGTNRPARRHERAP